MLIGDIVALADPKQQLDRMTKRLTPLCQGDALKKRPERAQELFAVLSLRQEARSGSVTKLLAGPTGPLVLAGLTRMGLTIGADTPAIESALVAFVSKHAPDLAFVDRAPNGFKALPMPPVIEIEKFLAGTPDPFVVVTAAFASVMDQGASNAERQVFLDVFHVADEVSVAGFESYFFLRAADRFEEAVGAMRALGLDEVAMLFDGAIALVAPSADTSRRRAQLAALTPAVKQELLGLSEDIQPERRKIAVALTAHVSRHRGAF